MKKLSAALLLYLGLASAALAQVISMPPPAGVIVNGCVFTTSPPVLTTGQIGYVQCSSTGAMLVAGTGSGGTTPVTGSTSNATSGVASSATNVASVSYNYWWNGTTWDQARDDPSTFGLLTVNTPTSSSASAITPIVTAAVASSLVIKASAGNLYGVELTTGGTAGYLLLFNATSAPADGAVTPIYCKVVAANSSIELSWTAGPPAAFAAGITAVFTTTGCFTKTASATAFIAGMMK